MKRIYKRIDIDALAVAKLEAVSDDFSETFFLPLRTWRDCDVVLKVARRRLAEKQRFRERFGKQCRKLRV